MQIETPFELGDVVYMVKAPYVIKCVIEYMDCFVTQPNEVTWCVSTSYRENERDVQHRVDAYKVFKTPEQAFDYMRMMVPEILDGMPK